MKTARKLWKINEHLLLDRVSEKVCGLVSWHTNVSYIKSLIFSASLVALLSLDGGWDGMGVLCSLAGLEPQVTFCAHVPPGPPVQPTPLWVDLD